MILVRYNPINLRRFSFYLSKPSKLIHIPSAVGSADWPLFDESPINSSSDPIV